MPDEFKKDIVKKFGARGSPVFEREQKTTDLEELSERIEETAVPFCTCGASIASTAEVYRCAGCEVIACDRCRIRLSRWHYCPTCARRKYALNKRAFLSLVFLQHGLMEAEDLVVIETIGDEPVEIEIDPVTTALLEHDYLSEDGTLSPKGKEALHVGKQLYGEDQDVQSVLNQIRIQEVVNG